MAKDLSFNRDARNGINSGVKKLADAVRSTLGPRGRTVIIEKEYGDCYSIGFWNNKFRYKKYRFR